TGELAELVADGGGAESRGGAGDPLSGARALLCRDLRVGLEDRPQEGAHPREEDDDRARGRGQGQLRRSQSRRLRGSLTALTPAASGSAPPARSASDRGQCPARATRP